MSAETTSTFAPTGLGKIFALRDVQPFDRLLATDLALLAEVAEPRAYAAGEQLQSGDEPATRLLVVVGGRALDERGAVAGPILGVSSLLLNLPPPRVVADPASGAQTIAIAKAHFFTLVRECPGFLIGLLELGDQGVRPDPS